MSSRDCNDCGNLLRRDGTSQKERLFEEQKTDYVQIDERSYIDLIQFALKYSEKVQFWDTFNRRSGDWTDFLQNDQASIYTEIANINLDERLTEFNVHFDSILPGETNDNTRLYTIGMMEKTFELATVLDEWLGKLESSLELTDDLRNIIQRQANPLLNTLKEYDYGAKEKLKFPFNPPTDTLSTIDYSSLSDLWNITAVPEDANSAIFETGTIPVKGVNGKRHFRVLFMSLLNVIEKLKENAEGRFNELLENYSKHEPHFALFLAFIQLYRYAQDHINEFTQKHLDFYYRDVLQLEEKEAVPDKLHVIMEPAKNVDQKLVEAGTELKAGKDASGKEITFETSEDIVLNKAKVGKLRSMFVDRGKNTKYIQTIYAADEANSKDGNGEKFTQPNPAWEPFGKTQVKDGVLIENQTMTAARVGFGIASPELRMAEGRRTITVTMSTVFDSFTSIFGNASSSQKGAFQEFLEVNPSFLGGATVVDEDYFPFFQALLAKWITIRFTGDKGWVIPDNLDNGGVPSVLIKTDGTGSITFTLTLSREQDPIVSYSNELHEQNYDTEWPIMEVLLDQNEIVQGQSPSLAYEFLKGLRFKSIKFDCDVKGVVSLNIANDTGTLDASKPFKPFTSNPQVGSNFYIGSSEVFSKRLTYLSVELDWKGVPEAKFSDYYSLYQKQEDPGDVTSNIVGIVGNNEHFQAELKILEDFSWKDLSIDATEAVVPMYQSSTLALSQDRSVMINPPTFFFFFFLMAAWQMATDVALMIKEWSIFPIRRNLTTPNFVNLFRAGEGDTDETDARLPKIIEVESKENGNEYSSTHKTNFDLLTVDEDSEDRYKRDPFIGELSDYKDGVKRGYMKLELINDFFHSAYPKILTERVTAQSAGVPNTPYTPELHKISLDYKSTFEVHYDLNLTDPISWDTRVEQFYHITPFGEVEVMPNAQEKKLTEDSQDVFYTDNLLPQLFKAGNEITSDGREEVKVDKATGRNVTVQLEETGEGALYIGIEDFEAPKTLSLLFQFKEGTEDNDLEVPGVEWSFLSHDQWVAFETAEIVSDETNGLINSGVVMFSVPNEATNDGVLYGTGMHWIRARVIGNTDAFSDLIAVHAQAVLATFVDNENDPYRISTEIEADTISKFVDSDFEVKSLAQPYASFNGRIKEQSTEYYTRVAERLRHKQRAINIRDYEHIVLEEFPEIYKTKCINHTSRHSEYAPGSVSVIVIPYFKNQNEKNPFELKVSKAKLSEIRRFLVRLNSPFVKLDVRNPKYETIRVSFGVEFKLGYDRTFYVDKLNEEIKEFISPWAFGKEEEIIFGGKINRSTILNFIEELPYVDYLTDFKLFHQEDENRAEVDVLVAEGTTASSVLVTALDHTILGPKEQYVPEGCGSTSDAGSGSTSGPTTGNESFDTNSYNESYN